MHVLQRRHPGLEIILAPCAVQGAGAAAEIAASIALLNQWSRLPGRALDIILVTRGGGSLEDLWAFNEEAVARAIFHSAVPVISAVGHEIDFTISDFVADFRAATPSAAAEILTEAVFSSCKWAAQAEGQMREMLRRRLAAEQRHWRQLGQRLLALHPRRQLNQRLQRLDELQTMLARGARRFLQKMQLTAGNLASRLGRMRPGQALARRGELLRQAQRRLREQAGRQLESRRQQCDALVARLRLLGPEQVLARGYSITLDDATGEIIRTAAATQPGQKLRTRLKSGEVRSTVS
jgi:exodeoxyribonuclease VII large subunit